MTRARRFLRGSTYIMVCTLLAGCAVGPNYILPKAAVVNLPTAQQPFVNSADNAAVSGAPPLAGWWRLYRSPDLDRLVAEALQANTDLRIAEANLERSQAMVQLARTQGQPQAGFQGGFERGLLSAENYLSEADLPVSNLYAIDLSASYEVDLFGRIKRGIEAARADDEAVAAARDWVRVSVAAKVTRAYLDACSAGDELAVAHRTIELQKRNRDLVHRLEVEGRATRLDETRSRTLVDQLLAGVPPIEARRRNALYQLAVLTGRPPGEVDPGAERCEAAPAIDQAIPVGDGAALLRRRPDVRAAERQLAASTAEIGVATADLYPRIVLHAGVGSTGLAGDFLLHKTDDWAVGPLVTWQLNQNAARARIAAATAAQKAQLARFDGVVLDALRETETALNVYRHDLQRQVILTTARDSAASAAADAHTLQAEGRSGDLATLDAERTLAGAEFSLAAIRTQIAQDQAVLFLALGGGWEREASGPQVGN